MVGLSVQGAPPSSSYLGDERRGEGSWRRRGGQRRRRRRRQSLGRAETCAGALPSRLSAGHPLAFWAVEELAGWYRRQL